jgi:hypothetical protein
MFQKLLLGNLELITKRKMFILYYLTKLELKKSQLVHEDE